jgi:lactoylglutathione lyase
MALIHTCYRITDIDRSVAFYNALGFEEIGRIPIKDEAVNVFMNQPGDGDMPRLELTYNFGVDSYDIGTGANLDLYSLAQAADGTWRIRAAERCQ